MKCSMDMLLSSIHIVMLGPCHVFDLNCCKYSMLPVTDKYHVEHVAYSTSCVAQNSTFSSTQSSHLGPTRTKFTQLLALQVHVHMYDFFIVHVLTITNNPFMMNNKCIIIIFPHFSNASTWRLWHVGDELITG